MTRRVLITCRILLVCLLALAAVAAFGAERLPARTPHGILADRVLPLAHLEDLDGSPAAAPATAARWRQAVHELRRAAETDLGWPAPRGLQQDLLAGADRHEVPLALVHARYDRLDDTGVPRAAESFVLAPLRDTVHHGAGLVVRLDPRAMLRHGVPAPVALTLDAGDGAGPRRLVPGRPLAVSYAETGRRVLELTARFADGTELVARAQLEVAALVTPAPTATWAVTAAEPWQGVTATGTAYLYLAAGRTAPLNPVVVVEGFDLDNTMDWPVLYDLLNTENMLEDLRADGYDAVVLDFTEATEPIQRNAGVLRALLARLDAELPPGRTVALVGASMGGLVSRYALLDMENAGAPHRVRSYISFDSPHLGANIPLGLQHWLRFFQSESADAAWLLTLLERPAARQMLLHHVSSTVNGSAAVADPLRAAWEADLAALGGWPVGPRLLAVANGSGTGLGQGYGPGAQLILYEYRSLLVDIDGNVWAVPDGGPSATVFDGAMNLIWPLPDAYETIGVGGTQPWDSAPGGSRASMAQMDTTAVPYGDIVALHDDHCFIPTVSALAVAGVGAYHDVAADANLASRIPFDAVYWPAANEPHVQITPANKAWLVGEIAAGVSAVDDVATGWGARLHAAVPNPFNPRTTISFELLRPSMVDLAVYDVRGRRVRNLQAGWRGAGRQRAIWDGTDDSGQGVASGSYLVRLQAGGELKIQRVLLVR